MYVFSRFHQVDGTFPNVFGWRSSKYGSSVGTVNTREPIVIFGGGGSCRLGGIGGGPLDGPGCSLKKSGPGGPSSRCGDGGLSWMRGCGDGGLSWMRGCQSSVSLPATEKTSSPSLSSSSGLLSSCGRSLSDISSVSGDWPVWWVSGASSVSAVGRELASLFQSGSGSSTATSTGGGRGTGCVVHWSRILMIGGGKLAPAFVAPVRGDRLGLGVMAAISLFRTQTRSFVLVSAKACSRSLETAFQSCLSRPHAIRGRLISSILCFTA